MKTLAPVRLRPGYYTLIEKQIADVFKRLIYVPITRDMKASGLYFDGIDYLKNASDPLYEAIASGRIEYQSGVFYGKFTAQTSKRLQAIGARWNGTKKAFVLDSVLPADLQIAVARADARYAALTRSLVRTLDDIPVGYAVDKMDLAGSYEATISHIDQVFAQTLKNVTIQPHLTPTAKRTLAVRWSNNLKLYIKKWTDQEILKLRQQVQRNSFVGHRSENLIKTIIDSYGVSKRKAKFLARQETSLLMSNMRQQRYEDAGITKYKWSTSHDERVRKRHVELDGKTFFWSQPPIVDQKGNRAHPGQDFNCRCVAIPILPGEE